MILGIHHVQITIPMGAEEEAKKFYCGLLGLEEIEKPASLKGRGGFWLRAGNDAVHVGTEDGAERGKTKAHLAYLAENAAYWRETLNSRGIQTYEGIPIPHYERFEFRDPFGNRVEIIQETE